MIARFSNEIFQFDDVYIIGNDIKFDNHGSNIYSFECKNSDSMITVFDELSSIISSQMNHYIKIIDLRNFEHKYS